MPKVLKIEMSVEKGVKGFLKYLLKSGTVKGIFSLKRISRDGAVAYSLITDVDAIDDTEPFYPFMPANAGKLLSRLTLRSPASEPIAAVVRPCELRGFVELLKREQGSLSNFFIISSTCPGVYPMKMSADGQIAPSVDVYRDAVKKAENADKIRPTCEACEHFIPYNADITVALVGKDIDKECEMFLNSDKAEEIAKGMDREAEDGELETESIKHYSTIRANGKKKLFSNTDTSNWGLSGLIDTFGKCVSCHGCRAVCPICYCGLCTFDSREREYDVSTLEKKLDKKKGLRLPPDTIFFHIGRVTHMGLSCVGCGMCTDICPANIPVSSIFLKSGESIQKLFNYLPGRDLEEPLPTSVFEKEEFTEVED